MLEFEKMLITKYPMLKVKNIEYYHYYTSSEGNKAFYTKASLGSKRFYIEIVRKPDFTWFFHIEKNNEMIFDSRIGGVYYESPDKAHSGIINAIMDKYERKELAKFCKTKSTKKR
jgi:hypothetical protein